MVEILARRTATRKVFDLGNQQRLYRCHAGLIHYEDGGRTWQEIDTTLQSRLGGYYQDRCAYQCELPATADGIFAYHHRGQEFVTRVVGAQPSRGIPSVDRLGQLGKSLTYPHALGPGIHLVIEARNEGLRKLIRFDQPPPDPTRDFVVIFEFQTDPGVVEVRVGEAFRVVDATQTAIGAEQLVDRQVRMTAATGAAIYITRPSCWDSDPTQRVRRWPVTTSFYRSAGKAYFVKAIPAAIFTKATYPIFADDPVNYSPPTNGNGSIESSSYAAWDTNHDATSGATYLTALDVGSLESASGSALYKMLRSFVPIDTAGIADTDTVTAAVLNLYFTASLNQDNDGDDWINVVQTTQASPTSIAAGDFDQCGAIDNPVEGSTRWDMTGQTTGQFHTWALNATGLGWVSKTSYTLLGLREGHDAIDVPVVTSGTFNGARATFSSDNTAGQEPYLDVTASAGGDPEGSLLGGKLLRGGLLANQGVLVR